MFGKDIIIKRRIIFALCLFVPLLIAFTVRVLRPDDNRTLIKTDEILPIPKDSVTSDRLYYATMRNLDRFEHALDGTAHLTITGRPMYIFFDAEDNPDDRTLESAYALAVYGHVINSLYLIVVGNNNYNLLFNPETANGAISQALKILAGYTSEDKPLWIVRGKGTFFAVIGDKAYALPYYGGNYDDDYCPSIKVDMGEIDIVKIEF